MCRWAYLGDDALAEEAREFHQRCGLDSLSTNRHSLGRRKWRSVMSWPWSTELSFFRSLFLAQSVSRSVCFHLQLSLFPALTLFPAQSVSSSVCFQLSAVKSAGWDCCPGRDPPGQSPSLQTAWPDTRAKPGFKHTYGEATERQLTNNAMLQWTANQLEKSIASLIAFQLHLFSTPKKKKKKKKIPENFDRLVFLFI